ncbi:MAG: aspartate--tRNA ligase [Hyphomonas sp.]|uniref:aspartate--tRNA ligase n=1 Tax=Hyphomonas sp. TaxID=87 RepID=UPI0017E484C7|nr:aspartate--tRNA ligase [Hyphomonas sp.]MBA3070078.1 aspartate--tRNA ligase [Hyphomonas sp.]MBU4060346.1 aspartate--tRNA ligase [Alphaproteobacteria bacterium]MBU4163014.1 aspartate--tRNA ligase [Alphaproteobacteria bacterium]
MHAYRTHTCGELRKSHVGETVKLSGWLHRRRDHGGVMFIDLRDHYGLTQIVFNPGSPGFETVERLRAESVITVEGKVVARDADLANANLATGEIEIVGGAVSVQSEAAELPMPVFGDHSYPEDIRLKHRYLDLRREALHKNMVLRSNVIASLRRRMVAEGFTEYQTPILTASSPEGARDFLVPSRMHPGEFYALPQAPQQFKQLLMVSGFDRYFQIAPCFRDEDARADRSPGEFYQLDIEMSFVTQEDVFAAIEPVMRGVFEEFADWDGKGRVVAPGPFPHIPYAEAMLKYGVDKPDLRNPILCCDVSDIATREDVTLAVFKKIVDGGGIVRAIPAPNTGEQPRSFFDKMDAWAKKEMQAPGLGYIRFVEEDGKLSGTGPIAKFFTPDALAALAARAGVKAGDALFFSAGDKTAAVKLQGQARIRIGEELGLIEPGIFRFCWIVDFPMYEWDEDNKCVDFSHNPFSMPQGGMEALLAADTVEKQLALKAFQYDIVCNGVELSSGAIRNHRPEIMLKAFELAGKGPNVVEEKFGGMLNAFRFGAPPHGGIAPGVDRIVMLLAEADSLRDVILFPMNQQARDLLMGAPSLVDERQLKELNIRLAPVMKS